jgi:hypothetical protein
MLNSIQIVSIFFGLLTSLITFTANAYNVTYSHEWNEDHSSQKQFVKFWSSSLEPEVVVWRYIRSDANGRRVSSCLVSGKLLDNVKRSGGGHVVIQIEGASERKYSIQDGYYGGFTRPHVELSCSDSDISGSLFLAGYDGTILDIDNDGDSLAFYFEDVSSL